MLSVYRDFAATTFLRNFGGQAVGRLQKSMTRNIRRLTD